MSLYAYDGTGVAFVIKVHGSVMSLGKFEERYRLTPNFSL